ncbi:hypothetical protein AAG747_08535 [Rapidithrix thailandica]|uniref:Uncharacterized protein n=1 Tax=Rapidithrix thailandica TaxID=413964 RepID=A0AAW9S9D6_9BACT
MESVPFRIELYDGFAETRGILRLENESVFLEFETKDSFFGVIKSGVQSIDIPLKYLSSAHLAKSIFGNKIILHAHSLKAFEKFPSSSSGELKLGIKRKFKHQAENLVTNINLKISEERLKALSEDNGSSNQLEQ